MNKHIDLTSVVVKKNGGLWGVKALSERPGVFSYGYWWIGSNGLPYHSTIDRDSTVTFNTQEEAQALADRLLGLEDYSGWNDHE